MRKFRVKELAQAQGITSEELSRRSKVKISTVRNVWQNKVQDPNYSTLSAIAGALGVKIEELVVEEGETEEGIRAPKPLAVGLAAA